MELKSEKRDTGQSIDNLDLPNQLFSRSTFEYNEKKPITFRVPLICPPASFRKNSDNLSPQIKNTYLEIFPEGQREPVPADTTNSLRFS